MPEPQGTACSAEEWCCWQCWRGWWARWEAGADSDRWQTGARRDHYLRRPFDLLPVSFALLDDRIRCQMHAQWTIPPE